jgi:N-acetylglucosaminyl-diphospho-decaprenol L-rhamnosyltransferase
MNDESVCAVVLDYYGAEKTEKCLLSLVGQGLKTTYLLDNSGSESASAKLSEVVDRLQPSRVDYRIEVLSIGKNLGFAGGVNFVLSYDRRSESPHDYYLLLNNDAVAGPALVSGLLAILKQNHAAVLVAPRIISDDPGREYGIWYHRYLGLLLSRPGRFRFHYFTGCCLLFQKALVGDTGLFDEAFFMYGEDAELGWRLIRQDREMICATEVFVRHDLGPSAERASLFYEYHMVRCHLLLSLRTWLHPAEIPFLMTTKYAALASRALIRCLRYWTLAPLVGLLLALFPANMERLYFRH